MREPSTSESKPPSRISVIIPAYNEALLVGPAIESCHALVPAPEIILADGASSDGTPALAASLGARVVACTRRGRAFQMNEGARAARGSVFLFLHADTQLDQAAWDALHAALRDPRVIFGAFRRRFDPPSVLLSIGSALAVLRGWLWKIFLGDQCIFVRRSAFEEIGGYSPILLFEDIDICRRLRRRGREVLVRGWVTTSRRRFQAEGNARRLARNVSLWIRYCFGADANRLARVYYPGYYETGAADAAGSAAESSSGARESKGMKSGS